MKLLIVNSSGERVPSRWLAKWAMALSRNLAKRRHKGLVRRELVLVFVDPREMRRLNRQYRQKDYATDVLSFAPAEAQSVGELVLCLPVLMRQAKRTGLSARGELGYMIVHGVLHLLGYDHEDRKDELRMFALQDQIFAGLAKRVGFR